MSQTLNYLLANNVLAFIEGLALIASPCILPILPIILSGTLQGDKKRAMGIIFGFAFTFALFSLFSRALILYFAIDLNILRQIAFILIMLFGIILVSDKLSDYFARLTQGIANLGNQAPLTSTQNPFWIGLLFGASVSLIWTPCAGPILAAVIVQTATQKTSLQSFFTFFCFALGSIIPMMLIALLGKKIIIHINYLKTKTQFLRKLFGIIIIFSALFAATIGQSAFFQTKTAPVSKVENGLLINALPTPYPAPTIEGIAQWLNSPPLTIEGLKGKVILIDFWAYSCINCVRTLPYLIQWYDKYHSHGFEIIGVHAPEFEFEKNVANVQKAIQQYHIPYPIALDNQFATWTNFHNLYWPAHYLIDKNGMVVYEHFGEGDYEITEHNIATLLNVPYHAKIKNEENDQLLMMIQQTPETYLGYSRADRTQEELFNNVPHHYTYPQTPLPLHYWTLNGDWTVEAEKIIAQNNASIKIHFKAKKVYMVIGSQNNQPLTVKVLLNNQPISSITVTTHGLYQILKDDAWQDGILELIFDDGAMLYTFTFG